MSQEAPKLKHRNLPLLLLQARAQVITHFRPIFNANGFTEQQWRIVRVLLDRDAMEPRQIGELCGISSPSMAGVLSRMEHLGYITRKRLEHDQRRVHIMLTARSRELAARMTPAIDATYERLEAQIGMEFAERFYRTLDEFIEALGTDALVLDDDD